MSSTLERTSTPTGSSVRKKRALEPVSIRPEKRGSASPMKNWD